LNQFIQKSSTKPITKQDEENEEDKDSLDTLNKPILQQQSINSLLFRPNIVISGSIPHEEDFWDEIQITPSNNNSSPSNVFKVEGPCARCSMININNSKNEISLQGTTLSSLAAYRKERRDVFFGQFLSSNQPPSTLHIGDNISPKHKGQNG